MKAFIKKPVLERISNTIKTSKSMFRDNTNTIKNFASGFVKKRIPKYKVPYAINETSHLLKTEGKKSFLMKSVGQMNRQNLGSLINMNFVRKMTTLIATGNLSYTQFPTNIGNIVELNMAAYQGNKHVGIDYETVGLHIDPNEGQVIKKKNNYLKKKKKKEIEYTSSDYDLDPKEHPYLNDEFFPMEDYDQRMEHTEEELRERLTPEQFRITQECYSEEIGTGIYNDFFEEGRYDCVVCNANLFTSEQKYKSDYGMATFWNGHEANVEDCFNGTKDLLEDDSEDLKNVRCKCKSCWAHLGYVSEGGPKKDEDGAIYKINSASLKFVSKKDLNSYLPSVIAKVSEGEPKKDEVCNKSNSARLNNDSKKEPNCFVDTVIPKIKK